MGALWEWGRVGAGTSLHLSSFGHQGLNKQESWLGQSLGFLSPIRLEVWGL